MDSEDKAHNLLECMLTDENAEPTDLPLSLLKSITKNFSDELRIGNGEFAVVYKGLLQNGTIVVNKLTQIISGHETKFRQEIDILMRIKHKNLVRFLGFCSNTQWKVWKLNEKNVVAEEHQRFLCFEYLPQGSLDKYISDASEGLGWVTRYQIIKGICQGLHYLHQHNIVHLNLTPGNILLNPYMLPKITDFSISKCFHERQTEAVTADIQGTLEYMAPESNGGLITFKSDIYSLGIIIIEILTGNKGCADIDNVLESWSIRFETSLGDTRLELVRVCTEIGIQCIDNNRAKRPDTRCILERLDEIENIYCVSEMVDEVQPFFLSEAPSPLRQITSRVPTGLGVTSAEVLNVHPLELRFPSVPDQDIISPVTLTNWTRHHVGVWITPTNQDNFYRLVSVDTLSDTLDDVWETDPSSSLFKMLGPRSTVVIPMAMIHHPGQEKHPRLDTGTFEVLMVVMGSKKDYFKSLKQSIGSRLNLDVDLLKRFEALAGEVYRAMLKASICEPTNCEAVVTHTFVPAPPSEIGNCINDIDVHPTEAFMVNLRHTEDVPKVMPLQLLREITNNFSEKHKLGCGTYGEVYKGVRNGAEIAIKVLHLTPGYDDLEQFKKEFENLTRLKHQNIVQLLGYCYEVKYEYVDLGGGRKVFAQKIYRALCFEYMHNGSLQKHLYDEQHGLDWQARYRIIKGICKGLKYLHEGLQNPMYHLDLKPDNILLDKNMVPKLADFGLSKLVHSDQTQVTQSTMGTMGYLPPEYIEENLVSKKLDIFSLGVIMIRIMTGYEGYFKKAEMSSQEFIDLVQKRWRERLQATPGCISLEYECHQVKRCIEISLDCVKADRKERPEIGMITHWLSEIDDMNDTFSHIEKVSSISELVDKVLSVDVAPAPFEPQQKNSIPDRPVEISTEVSSLPYPNVGSSMEILEIEEEFRLLMSTCSKPIKPEQLFDCLPKSMRPTKGDNESDSATAIYRTPKLIPPRVLPLLNDIAQQLVQAGNQHSCYEIYRDSRASALELSLCKLGVEKLSTDDVQKMQWEALEAKIQNWIHFMRIAVKLLLSGERHICDQVFDGVNFNKGQCFAEVTTNSVMTLLSFGDAVARSTRSPEEIFVLLDMYNVMREFQSEIELIFEDKSCSETREAVLGLTKCLAQTVLTIFTDFEESIETNYSKIIQDGNVDPLTSYVLNYLIFLFDYQWTWKLVCQEFDNGSYAEFQLAVATPRILQALQNNLDGKSNQYKDPALSYLFLMNNIHFMVKSMGRPEAKHILGDDWFQRHHRIVQQNANQYRRVACEKIVETLSVKVDYTIGDNSRKDSTWTIKERFMAFNMQLKELHAKHSQWSVPDKELRETLRLAVAQILLPAYRTFNGRYGSLVNHGKTPQKYIRYSPEVVEELLGQFFEGQRAVQ